MNEYWIKPDYVFDGHDLLANAALQVNNGYVANVVAELPEGVVCRNIAGTVTPGFVDIQVNGGGGVLFNTTPTEQGLVKIAQAHWSYGTVAIMPTVITDAPEVLEKVVSASLIAKGEKGIAGLHIEGPHISLERRGTHSAEFIRSMDDVTMNAIAKLCLNNIPTIITVAPEMIRLDQITQIVDQGAVVSLGHTNATGDMMCKAIEAGANCVTHLYNGMSPMEGREQGAVGSAINSDAYIGIICDGRHVSDEMVALAIRARPIENRMILVSDAMPTVGGPDYFDLYGKRISVVDGCLINSEGSLAGAHTTQAQGVKRLVDKIGISPQHALQMAITNPATCIGLQSLYKVQNRSIADLILLDTQLNYVCSLCDV